MRPWWTWRPPSLPWQLWPKVSVRPPWRRGEQLRRGGLWGSCVHTPYAIACQVVNGNGSQKHPPQNTERPHPSTAFSGGSLRHEHHKGRLLICRSGGGGFAGRRRHRAPALPRPGAGGLTGAMRNEERMKDKDQDQHSTAQHSTPAGWGLLNCVLLFTSSPEHCKQTRTQGELCSPQHHSAA